MIGRPVNPNSARQQRIRAAQGRQKLHARPKLATDNGKLVIPHGLIDAIQANAKERRKTRADHPELNPFRVNSTQLHPPGSRPPTEVQMAMDQALGWASGEWGSGGPLGQVFAEGLAFPGYPYLSELAQRPEYRTAGEIISTEMTRKWIQFSGKGTAHQQRQRDRKMAEDFGLPDPHAEQREDDEAPDSSEKQEKIAQLEEFLDNLNCRGAYRLLEATDCYFGRAHLFHEINGNDGSSSEGSEELQSDLGLGIGDTSRGKVGRKSPLTRLTNVEPVWIYPTTYNAMNPLVKDFYNPSVWYMQGIPVHCSRMFTQIGRPVPDLLKPAYSFGGLSLSQIMQPYVNIWLETRESIGRLIHAFSVMVLFTDLQTLMQPGGGALMERINLFNTLRDNNGCFVINKSTEDFKNISVPLGGLHELQAQSQEHMASIIRVPVAIYTGISPTGLNASSEGEIRIFENNIHAAQESRYRQNLTKTINFAQLSLWDEIDPDITFDFVQLRELTEKEEAELRKLDAETDDILMNGCQAISPEEVRIRVAGDDNGPHAGIDPDDMPEPPQPPPGEGAPGAEGAAKPGEDPGEPKPGGRINVTGREEYTGVGENEGRAHDSEFKEGDHPRAPDGKFGSGGGGSKEVHVTARTNENGKPVILGAHPTAHAAEAHRDQVHKSDWDKQQREDFDDPEDREEFPGHEGFMKGQNNAHGELANPENIVRWHAGSGGVGEGGETHVVATGEHSEAAGGPTMNIKVHGSYATKREAEAAASVVAAQAWAQHGDTLGHHEDEWAEATTDTINDWNSAHPNDEPIDPEMVAIAGNRTGPDAWYVNVVGPDDELFEKKLPPELAKQIDALEEQPAPYPGLKKALAYWRDAGDYEHVAPVIKQLKMAP